MTISQRRKVAVAGAVLASVLLAVVGVIDGRTVLEKIALRLITPVGLVWLALAVQTVWTSVRGQRRAAAWSCGLLMTVTLLGNGWVAGEFLSRIEQPYAEIDPLAGPEFDTVVILGGGSVMGAAGRPQLNGAGDRLALAAQMYHARKARQLICTGQTIRELNPDGLDPAEQSQQILERLGVPAGAIRRSGGRNTAEEFRNLAGVVEPGLSIGVLTSAWHLPRAMRLAKSNGLDAAPVPADFRGALQSDEQQTRRLGAIIMSLIPSSDAMTANAMLWKEGLAYLVGR